MAQPGGNQEEGADESRDELGKLGGRLGRMSLRKQVMTLAMWPFLEQILGFLVSAVDLIFTGRLAEGELRVAMMDAMGIGGYIAWLLMIMQGSVGTGVMALVSRATGAREGALAGKALTQGLMLGLATGVLVSVVLSLLLSTIVSVFGLSDESAEQALSYLRVLVWSAPVLGLMLVATNALRGAGDTRTPFLAMVVVNLVNVFLSWLFVFGQEEGQGMGVAGLALGSVLGWVSGALVLIAFLLLRRDKEQGEVFLTLRGCRFYPEPEVMRRIIKVGVPQALEMGGMWAIQSVMLGFISGLPQEGALGSHMIAIRVESMSFLPGFAIGSAGAALVGQYLGAGSPTMAMKAARISWSYAAIFMSLLGLLFLSCSRELVALIVPEGPDSQHFQDLAGPLIFLCGLSQPFLATVLVMKTTMRGAGATQLVMRYSYSTMLFYRVFIIPVGVSFFGLGLTGIWVVMFIDVITQAILFSRIHFRGDWLRAKV